MRINERSALIAGSLAGLLSFATATALAAPPAADSSSPPAATATGTPAADSSAAAAPAQPSSSSAAARARRARKETEIPALFGMGAQSCKAFTDVAPEADNREIAISGAMFSWAQGWFSARNVIGHENAPRTVGSTLSSEKLKAMLVMECHGHPDESLFLAADDLYDRLLREGR
jgi:hypothetical protein